MTSLSLSRPSIPSALSNPGLPVMDAAVFDLDDLSAMCAEYEERISVAQESRERAERELASFRARVEREIKEAKGAANAELAATKLEMQTELNARIKKAVSENQGPREDAEAKLAAAQERLLEMTEEIRNLRGVIAKLAAHPSMTDIPVVKQAPAAPAPKQPQSGVARMMRTPQTWAEQPAAHAAPARTPPPVPADDDAGSKPKRRRLRARRR